MATLLWLQAGARSGNTISLLQAEEPTVIDLLPTSVSNAASTGISTLPGAI